MLCLVLVGSLVGLCSAVAGLSGGLGVTDVFLLYVGMSLGVVCVVPVTCHVGHRLWGRGQSSP